MNLLILKGYNNYFNRIVKKLGSTAAYKSAVTNYLDISNMNFNPNDGVTTQLILGKGELNWENNDGHTPDYLVAYSVSNNVETIESRWFVIECERTRGGQYQIALKRDVLADFENEYMDAPCFVEKGVINDVNNPLLYNNENNILNQIKQKETLIKDTSNCAWLVGYMKKDATSNVSGVLSQDLNNYRSASTLGFKDCIQYIDANGEYVGSPTKTAVSKDGTMMIYFKINHRPEYAYEGKVKGYADYTENPFVFDGTSNNNYNGVASCALDSSQDGWNADDAYKKDVKKINEKVNTANSAARTKYQTMVNTCVPALYTQHAIYKGDDDILNYNGTLISYSSKVWRLHIQKASEITSYNTTFTYSDGTAAEQAAKAFFSQIATDVSTLTLNTSSLSSQKVAFQFETNIYTITASEEQVAETITATIPGVSNRKQTNDALFDIFAIPYNPDPTVSYKFKYNGNTYELNSEVSLLMANLLIADLGLGEQGNAYDLQLLPYCPIDVTSYPINCGSGTNKTFSMIMDGNSKPKSFIVFPTESNFTKNIPLVKNYNKVKQADIESEWTDVEATWNPDGLLYMCSVSLSDIPADAFDVTGWLAIHWNGGTIPCYPYGTAPETEDPVAEWAYYENVITFWIYNVDYIPNVVIFDDIVAEMTYKYYEAPTTLELKVANEADFMRLTSPNYNGMYEFKLAKFNDGIHYINVDCTYKPVNPYIKLNPDYSFLYGQDFNDATGLILGGDFSLPLLTDPWNQYELANKNYQNIFNRGILNLDTMNQIAQEQQIFQGIAGIVTGGITGAAGGAVLGAKAGPIGVAAGAALGGIGGSVAGAVGFEKDREWLRRQQGEAKSYQTDMFNYQLGNVKALPQSVTKSSPLTYNNKIWPILEEFSCTDTEKEIVRNKIEYNGMSIMALGKLSDYAESTQIAKPFLKGQLIRVENIKDDFHIVDALYEEVSKGFYKGD